MKAPLGIITFIFVFYGAHLNASGGDHHEHGHANTRHTGHSHTNHSDHAEGESHNKHDDHKGHDHHQENSSHIQNALAHQVGIITAPASAQTLYKTVTAYGTLAAGPEQLSHVRARFEGMVKAVKVTIGDTVNAGDLLAEVESNESLKTYKIHAPISGLIVQRHANTGEVTQDQILFSIANYSSLWAELRIYPAQQSAVHSGQPVKLLVNEKNIISTVSHVIPALEKPYQLARVKLDNHELTLAPGLMAEARVETHRIQAPLAVTKEAVQTLGGRQGVFVKQGEAYQFTPLILGAHDDTFVEVLSGLDEGTQYVTQNSYLIKADIEKSEAEHDH